MSHRSLLVLSFVWTVALACPALTVAASFTYRFGDEGERLFRYAGGLMGGSFDARLVGTFDIERNDDGLATITRFDVYIADPLPLGPSSILGDPAGKPLSDYLIHNPVGLLLSPFSPSGPAGGGIDVSTHARTQISISTFESPTANLALYSGFNALLDAPASFIREGGTRIDLVPEPAAAAMLATACGAIVIVRRSYPRSWSSRETGQGAHA